MNTFVEIVAMNPVDKSAVKMLINTGNINALNADSTGRAVIVSPAIGAYGGATKTLNTYESYASITARILTLSSTNMTATVSASDYNTAVANQQAAQQAAASATTTEATS